MVQEQAKKILNIATIALFTAMLLTALILIIFFPPMKGIGYQAFLGTPKTLWLPIHKWLGIAFALVAIVGFFLSLKKKE